MANAKELLAELEARDARMNSPLWNKDERARQGAYLGPLVTSPQTESSESPPVVPMTAQTVRPVSPEPLESDVACRLDALERRIAAWPESRQLQPSYTAGGNDCPAWLQQIAGNPHGFDSRVAGRLSACIRIAPATLARVRLIKSVLQFRTVAGTWEYLLQIGLLTVDRLQLR